MMNRVSVVTVLVGPEKNKVKFPSEPLNLHVIMDFAIEFNYFKYLKSSIGQTRVRTSKKN
jgi:hypothetical protein